MLIFAVVYKENNAKCSVKYSYLNDVKQPWNGGVAGGDLSELKGTQTLKNRRHVKISSGDRVVSESYELSQEIMDKRVEVICRKYGEDAFRASIIIQRAYRRHVIYKRFKDLALNALRARDQRVGSSHQQMNQVKNQPAHPRLPHQPLTMNHNNSNIPMMCVTPNPKRFSNASIHSSSSSSSSTAASSGNGYSMINSLIPGAIHINGTGKSISHQPSPFISNHSNLYQHSLNSHHPPQPLHPQHPLNIAYPNGGMQKSPTMPSLQQAGRMAMAWQNQAALKWSQSISNFPPAQRVALNHQNILHNALKRREFRVGVNLFNKSPPERGIDYLFEKGFIEDVHGDLMFRASEDIEECRKASRVAHFLCTRRGLSKQMIGEYLGNLRNPFNQLVLQYFVRELDFSDMLVDEALRKFQTYFRFPGEAQKIERLVETFSERFCECYNSNGIIRYSGGDDDELGNESGEKYSKDSVFILSYAIIMLNTDLHVPTNRNRMTKEQWLKNLPSTVTSEFNKEYLLGIYDRIKSAEMKTGSDHCSQVFKVQSSLLSPSKSESVPNLSSNTYRRLICCCRLNEIIDIKKKEKSTRHQRDVFLFNDMLLITKSPKKSSAGKEVANVSVDSDTVTTQYVYRKSISLSLVNVSLFSTSLYSYGIRISSKVDKDKPLILFSAHNDDDRQLFFEDLKECIAEVLMMEMLRIQNTKKKLSPASTATNSPTSSIKSHNDVNHNQSSNELKTTVETPLNGQRSSTPSTNVTKDVLTNNNSNNSNNSSLMDLTTSSISSLPSSLSSSSQRLTKIEQTSLDSVPKMEKISSTALYI